MERVTVGYRQFVFLPCSSRRCDHCESERHASSLFFVSRGCGALVYTRRPFPDRYTRSGAYRAWWFLRTPLQLLFKCIVIMVIWPPGVHPNRKQCQWQCPPNPHRTPVIQATCEYKDLKDNIL